jgi:hypothetical protein
MESEKKIIQQLEKCQNFHYFVRDVFTGTKSSYRAPEKCTMRQQAHQPLTIIIYNILYFLPLLSLA